MKIDTISPVFKGNPIRILAKDNKHKEFLYNELTEIVQKNRLRALFSNKGVEIYNPTKEVTDKLVKTGIKFDKMA